MIKSLFRISVSLGLIGIVLGIVMGIRQDFALMPAHAHLNLLGFVTLFLSALYYRVVPEAAASTLARYQAIVSVTPACCWAGMSASSPLWSPAHSRFCSAWHYSR
jgi:hypothetical protein